MAEGFVDVNQLQGLYLNAVPIVQNAGFYDLLNLSGVVWPIEILPVVGGEQVVDCNWGSWCRRFVQQ